MTLKKKALEGVFWSALEKWGAKTANILVFLVLARLLEPKAFGLVALGTVFVALVRVIVDQGFADALVQREDLEEAHLDTTFWTNLVLGLVMCGGTVLASGTIAQLFGEPDLEPVLKGLALIIPLRGLAGVQEAQFRRNLNFQLLSVRSLISTTIGGIVGIGMAFEGYGVWSLVGQQVIRNAIETTVLWTASDWFPRFSISFSHFKDLFSFGVSILGTKMLNFLNRRLDDLLIGSFLGSTALGYYSVAYKILRSLTSLIASVGSQVAFPTFSRMQDEPERMRRAFYDVTKIASLVGFPVFIGLAMAAPVVIPLVFGTQWMASVPVMQILAFIGILHTVFFFNGNVILANGKASWRFGINVLNAAGNAVAFVVAVQWGIEAVALAYVLRGYVLAPVPLWLVDRLINISIWTYLKQFRVPIAGSLMLALTVGVAGILLKGQIPLWGIALVQTIVGGATYLGTVQLISPATAHQFLELVKAVRAT